MGHRDLYPSFGFHLRDLAAHEAERRRIESRALVSRSPFRFQTSQGSCGGPKSTIGGLDLDDENVPWLDCIREGYGFIDSPYRVPNIIHMIDLRSQVNGCDAQQQQQHDDNHDIDKIYFPDDFPVTGVISADLIAFSNYRNDLIAPLFHGYSMSEIWRDMPDSHSQDYRLEPASQAQVAWLDQQDDPFALEPNYTPHPMMIEPNDGIMMDADYIDDQDPYLPAQTVYPV